MARKPAAQPPHQADPAQAPATGPTPLSPASPVAVRPVRLDAQAGAATSTVASAAATDITPPPVVFSAPLRSVASAREYAHCDLCGQPLGRDVGHFHMVSPLTARRVSVCRTCRRAALSEGYRPRA
jgi:hypothetical protein